ncbi:DUF1302 family protein [Azoarcus sp. DN11]|uniref:DUF1302 domain-containing protein n=1 Tax=Azoarcus sp. DN11 TaxID=356837 RepID=UPI000EB580E2|nr:DUF1302 family protein [Azoarcus sp. DN11]AYH43534.1 hypothetical protein CDA09_09085 [Azoarcus sp. DN11]
MIEKRADKRLKVGGVASFIAVLMAPGVAGAFEVNSGNPDLQIRFDNTLRYNVGMRVEPRNSKIFNNRNFDEADGKFDNGDIVTNRLDLLTEFDFIYKGHSGFRVSAAGWYDHAYEDDSLRGNPVFGSQNTYAGNKYSRTVKRFNHGPSGEFLDVFAFTKFDIGEVPVAVKLGQHNVFWGESLFTTSNSIAYSQGPIDGRKAAASPGIEAKEVFLPLNQLSLQAQITPDFSMAAQYYFEWQPTRIPDGGTYLGTSDFFTVSGGTFLAPGIPFKGVTGKPDDQGDWGVMAKWAPEWMGGTLGAYYRKFGEKLPWVLLAPNGRSAGLGYADDVELYGVSFSKLIGTTSFGAEVSYRKNTGLSSAVRRATEGARGDTWHWLVNAVTYFGRNPLWSSASLSAEINGSVLDKVTSGEGLFNREGSAVCPGDRFDACITRSETAMNIKIEPLWYQVMPGVDLKMPISFGVGLDGNGAQSSGGNRQGKGSYSIGLTAEVQNKYTFTLAYIDYLCRFRDNGTALTTQNCAGTTYNDRGWVSFLFKTSF